MNEESLNPDNVDPSSKQEALPGQESVKMYESPPPSKKPNHTAEMIQGIKLTLWWYFGIFCLTELLFIKSASSILPGLWFSVLLLVPIWILASLILLVITLARRKFYMTLGVVIVTASGLLLSGAFCIGAPIVAESMGIPVP